jgi:transcriptional regulator with XRE-family HTH domain
MEGYTDGDGPELLKKARQTMGLTQEEFGARLGGRSSRTIMRWEQGKSFVSPDALVAVAVLVGDVNPGLGRALCDHARGLAKSLGLALTVPLRFVEPELMPPPATTPGLAPIEGVLRDSAAALRVSVEGLRAAVRATLERAQASGLSLEELRRRL